MNIIVTGGAGYIGSVVVSQLMDAGHTVVVFDNLSKGHRGAVHKGARLAVGDICDAQGVDRVFQSRSFDAVMHFAASAEVGESMRAPELYFQNNSCGSLNILNAMVKNGVSKIVFSSTAALFGEPRQVPILESGEPVPTNPYGESKLMVERMLKWFHSIYGIRYASLRYFNVAGATETLGEHHDPESHLIPLILQVANGKRSHGSILGTDYPTEDGTCIRDYIHVSDLARAHVLALDALNRQACMVYNLGNGRGFSVRQVVAAVQLVTGKAIPLQELPRRAGDPTTLVASSEKIFRELGWKPKYPELETIIESAWRWLQRHPNGYIDA